MDAYKEEQIKELRSMKILTDQQKKFLASVGTVTLTGAVAYLLYGHINLHRTVEYHTGILDAITKASDISFKESSEN